MIAVDTLRALIASGMIIDAKAGEPLEVPVAAELISEMAIDSASEMVAYDARQLKESLEALVEAEAAT